MKTLTFGLLMLSLFFAPYAAKAQGWDVLNIVDDYGGDTGERFAMGPWETANRYGYRHVKAQLLVECDGSISIRFMDSPDIPRETGEGFFILAKVDTVEAQWVATKFPESDYNGMVRVQIGYPDPFGLAALAKMDPVYIAPASNPEKRRAALADIGRAHLRMIANATRLGVLMPWYGGYLEDETELPFLFDLTGSQHAIERACGAVE